jgi:hypothetical protein
MTAKSKVILGGWIVEALQDFGGRATLIDVCRHVWEHHEVELADSDALFYTWQYDIRWAATQLRTSGKMRAASKSLRGVWELEG